MLWVDSLLSKLYLYIIDLKGNFSYTVLVELEEASISCVSPSGGGTLEETSQQPDGRRM